MHTCHFVMIKKIYMLYINLYFCDRVLLLKDGENMDYETSANSYNISYQTKRIDATCCKLSRDNACSCFYE